MPLAPPMPRETPQTRNQELAETTAFETNQQVAWSVDGCNACITEARSMLRDSRSCVALLGSNVRSSVSVGLSIQPLSIALSSLQWMLSGVAIFDRRS